MFPGKKHKDHRSLSKGLDFKILNYVRELTQVQLDSATSANPLGVGQLYNLIQERDSQLRRTKKAQLEASIRRALNVLRSEIVIDSDDEIFDSDGIEDLNLTEVKVFSSFFVLVLIKGYKCSKSTYHQPVEIKSVTHGIRGSNA